MKVLILGGTGFIGTHLSNHLQELGHDVLIGTRSPEKVNSSAEAMLWPLDPANDYTAIDVVINLAGETINQRWTKQARQRIIASRVETTRKLVSYIREGILKPLTVINGSAIGFYGTTTTDTLSEASPAGDDFLAEVTKAWETEADEISVLGVRLIKARIGLVLGIDGGALPKMLLPYKLFAGGNLGSGEQWVSWVHMRDLVRLFAYCISNTQLEGAVNITAPNPVQMETLGKTIGKVLNRPHWLPAPSFAMRLLLGEMSELVLKGQKVVPDKALATGFNFEYPRLQPALEEILGKK